MPHSLLTCDQVERDELDLKYLQGRLGPEQAESFEEHFFACDRCWDLVRAGQELRASRPVSAAPFRRRWVMLAAAVLVAAVGVGLWQGRPGPAGVAPDSLRAGPAPNALDVRVLPGGSGPGAVWNIVSGAASYRVRLFTQNGGLVLERELLDTSFAVPRDSLAASGPHYWQVQALDRLGAELSRSGLIEAVSPPP